MMEYVHYINEILSIWKRTLIQNYTHNKKQPVRESVAYDLSTSIQAI